MVLFKSTEQLAFAHAMLRASYFRMAIELQETKPIYWAIHGTEHCIQCVESLAGVAAQCDAAEFNLLRQLHLQSQLEAAASSAARPV